MPDLIVEAKDRRYVVEIKAASEGRSDRLIPLLSQAILEAQTISRGDDRVVPVAVVASYRIPHIVAERVVAFGRQHAPHVGVGAIDSQGLRLFSGHGLEALNAQPARRSSQPVSKRLPDLFSDLNQWMLKILLGQRISKSLISVPRANFRNATQLANAASVSVMSASRFVSQLGTEGFLDEDTDSLRVVRVDELLERWVSANRHLAQQIPARWIIKRDVRQLYADIAHQMVEANPVDLGSGNAPRSRIDPLGPRCCLGLFAAADALGLGFVHGVPPHLYLERLDKDIIRHLGLAVSESEDRPDVLLRIPGKRESVFRPAVRRDGLPVSDVLQVWLDVSTHPARGREQAAAIRRQALAPLFE
jgi:hypothetical protein